MEKGYVHVYTGDGKGKTTAALGLGLRAVGRGLKVVVVQFLKGTSSGELEAVKCFGDNFKIIRFAETDKFSWSLTEKEKKQLEENTREGFKKIYEIMEGGCCDILVLDEIMAAIHAGFVSVADVCRIIDKKPEGIELVLTGRAAPAEIIEKADLVTEMKCIKHYIHSGVSAREGIEK